MDFPAVYSHSTLVQNIFLPPFQEGQEIFLSRERMFPEMLGPWEEWGEGGCSCSQATERNVFWWPMWSVWAVADGALISACLLSHFSLVQLFSRTVAHLTPLIPQARILEWVAVPSSRGSSRLRDQTHLLPLPLWHAGSLPVPAKPNGGLLLRANGRQAKAVPTHVWCYVPVWMAGHSLQALAWLRWCFFVTRVLCMWDSILKSRDITLPTKVHLVKAMVFPVVMYGCESWTIKKAECQRIDAFWTVVLEKTLESLGPQGDPTSPS